MGNLWMKGSVLGSVLGMAQIIPISGTLNLLTHSPVSVRKWWPHSSLTQCNFSEKFRSSLKRTLNQHHHDDENDNNRHGIVHCLRNSSTNLTEMSPSTQRSYNLKKSATCSKPPTTGSSRATLWACQQWWDHPTQQHHFARWPRT